jgi:hypothetical protein
MEYEFDLVCDIDWSHIMTVSKSRCSAVADMIVEKPGPTFIQPVIEWLSSGSKPVAEPAFVPVKAPSFTLDDLLALYDADKIIDANGGSIPESQEDIEAVALKLGAA